MTAINGPGVYPDIPDDVYHADPVLHLGGSLSSTGARKLLDCPARFEYDRRQPTHTSDEFDLGHAAHRDALGTGVEFEVCDFPTWGSNKAKEAKAAARAAGRTPLKPDQFAQVEQMGIALRKHPTAGPMFERGLGQSELTLIWQDDSTGVWCRARLDRWIDPFIVDYKTTTDASPDKFRWAVEDHGYHIQRSFYLRGAHALGLDPAEFLFVAQEKKPPYFVGLYRISARSARIGDLLVQAALERYRDCTASGLWPGYSTEVETLTLSPRAQRKVYALDAA